jgi:hypothetical protein
MPAEHARDDQEAAARVVARGEAAQRIERPGRLVDRDVQGPGRQADGAELRLHETGRVQHVQAIR